MSSSSTVSVEGLLQLFSAVLLFGSMFVPLKKFDAGDGFFAQWIMSVAILMVGFAVFAWQSFAHFYPVAMLGGCFWSLGNMMAIPIIQRLGMALGILIWNSTNCLVGWAIGTFGGFGIEPRPASNPWLSYTGLFLIFIGGVLFTFVRNKETPPEPKNPTYQVYQLADMEKVPTDEKEVPILAVNGHPDSLSEDDIPEKANKWDRFIGIGMALVSGSLYGINISPVIYIQDNRERFPNAPSDGLPYAFSHFFGAFIMCTLGFVTYALVRKNQPRINPNIPVPALLSGLIWGVAQTLMLACTARLSAAISYPISAMLPGCVAAVWSVFYFDEIEGGRNMAVLVVAILVTLSGAVCIGASK